MDAKHIVVEACNKPESVTPRISLKDSKSTCTKSRFRECLDLVQAKAQKTVMLWI